MKKQEKLFESLKANWKREVEALKQKIATYETKSIAMKMEKINDVDILFYSFEDKTVDDLKIMVDDLKATNEKVVVVLSIHLKKYLLLEFQKYW